MGIREDLKQVDDLKESIIRLCNEADSNGIVINALLGSLCDHASHMGISPMDTVRALLYYINAISSEDTKLDITELKDGKIGVNRKTSRRNRL
jgi:effector-binding domain-containing protein